MRNYLVDLIADISGPDVTRTHSSSGTYDLSRSPKLNHTTSEPDRNRDGKEVSALYRIVVVVVVAVFALGRCAISAFQLSRAVYLA